MDSDAEFVGCISLLLRYPHSRALAQLPGLICAGPQDRHVTESALSSEAETSAVFTRSASVEGT